MNKLLLTCFLSAVVGAVFVGASHPLWHQEDDARAARNGKDELVIAADASNEGSSEFSAENSRTDTHNKAQTFADAAPPALDVEYPEDTPRIDDLANPQSGVPLNSLGRGLPATYAPLVTPPSAPKRVTTQELYQRFVEDERDEAWAYGMELGINQFVADHGAEIGARFDFVGCRGRYCMLAGALYGGGESGYNEMMAGMTHSGWWQASGGNYTSAYSTDTEYRFVTILPRTYEDASLTDPSAQPDVINPSASPH